MTTSLIPKPKDSSNFFCEYGEGKPPACAGEPFYEEYKGKRYCVLHFPGKEKVPTFREALKRKLRANDFNFRGVWFPEKLEFNRFHFTKEVDFRSATFNDQAIFFSATFDGQVDFKNATFIREVEFAFATFNGPANFRSCKFHAGVDFRFIQFKHLNFFYTLFSDYVRFEGTVEQDFSGGSLDFQYSRIIKPEQISFHTTTLLPHCFVNVDARKFNFTNVEWLNTVRNEIDNLNSKSVSPPHRLLAIACRQLAVNAEENHLYEDASNFRYMAMDAQRLKKWRGFAFWRLSWWYWLASGYGERSLRAFVVLIGVWLLFALLYTQVGFARWEPRRSNEKEAATEPRDEVGEPLKWLRAFTYSLGVMTLQKPEPRPATTAAQSLVILETILGPLQAALLALAIRRKFMR